MNIKVNQLTISLQNGIYLYRFHTVNPCRSNFARHGEEECIYRDRNQIGLLSRRKGGNIQGGWGQLRVRASGTTLSRASLRAGAGRRPGVLRRALCGHAILRIHFCDKRSDF